LLTVGATANADVATIAATTATVILFILIFFFIVSGHHVTKLLCIISCLTPRVNDGIAYIGLGEVVQLNESNRKGKVSRWTSRGKKEERQGTEEASAYGFLKQCLVTTKPSVGLDKPRVGFIQTKHWFYKNQVLVYSKQMLGLSKTNTWFV
jgi:hypothetical protein